MEDSGKVCTKMLRVALVRRKVFTCFLIYFYAAEFLRVSITFMQIEKMLLS